MIWPDQGSKLRSTPCKASYLSITPPIRLLMSKGNRAKWQTTIYKTLHRKLKSSIKNPAKNMVWREVPAQQVITWACPFLLVLVGFLLFNVVKFPCCDVRYAFRVKRCSVRLYYYLLCRRFMFYLCFLYLFTHTDVQHDFHVRWFWCDSPVIRRVTIVEQELPTLPEHLGFALFYLF